MKVLRRRLASVVCGWLCCQLSILTAAPLSLYAGAAHALGSMSCTCVHGDHAQCPMHHPAHPKPDCQCRNTTDPDAATIVSLLGPVAVLVGTPSRPTPPAATKSPNHHITTFVSFIAPPDGPPPRA